MFYWSLECMFHNVPSLRGLFAMNFERCTCPWTQLSFNMGEMCLSIVLKPWSSYKLFFRFFLAWFSVSYTNCWLAGGLPAEYVLPSSSHCWAGIPVHKNCPVHAAWHSHSASSGRELRLAADEPFVVWNCSTPPQASPRGDISTTWKKPFIFRLTLNLTSELLCAEAKGTPNSSGIHSLANTVQLHFSLYPHTFLLKLVWALKYQFNSAELISNC